MKWTIEIDSPNEGDAAKVLETVVRTFKIASKYKQPLHHVSLEKDKTKLVCYSVKK